MNVCLIVNNKKLNLKCFVFFLIFFGGKIFFIDSVKLKYRESNVVLVVEFKLF